MGFEITEWKGRTRKVRGQFEGQQIEFEYRSHAYTAEESGKLIAEIIDEKRPFDERTAANIRMLADTIVDWNVEIHGEKLPVNIDSISSLPSDLVWFLSELMTKDKEIAKKQNR